MNTLEERMSSLELEVAGMKALLLRPASPNNDWDSTVGVFESDPLFQEAVRLGREYRENQLQEENCEGT